jgi:hypothetical protein
MAGLFSSSRGFTSANDIIAVSDFDNTFAKHSGGRPVVIFEDGYKRYKDLMTPEEIEQLASLIRIFKGYRIPFHVVSWADEVLLKQYLQHVLEPHENAYNMITGIHGSTLGNVYPKKSTTINSFRNGKKVIFIDDDEKNIDDVRTNVPLALAIKAEPGKTSANMVALAVATLRDPAAMQTTEMHGAIDMDGGLKRKKSKRKTKKSKSKTKRKTMKK